MPTGSRRPRWNADRGRDRVGRSRRLRGGQDRTQAAGRSAGNEGSARHRHSRPRGSPYRSHDPRPARRDGGSRVPGPFRAGVDRHARRRGVGRHGARGTANSVAAAGGLLRPARANLRARRHPPEASPRASQPAETASARRGGGGARRRGDAGPAFCRRTLSLGRTRPPHPASRRVGVGRERLRPTARGRRQRQDGASGSRCRYPRRVRRCRAASRPGLRRRSGLGVRRDHGVRPSPRGGGLGPRRPRRPGKGRRRCPAPRSLRKARRRPGLHRGMVEGEDDFG